MKVIFTDNKKTAEVADEYAVRLMEQGKAIAAEEKEEPKAEPKAEAKAEPKKAAKEK